MHVAHFQSPDLYKRVMILLESYRFRLHVRRQIIELFDKQVLERIVKDGMKSMMDDFPPRSSESPEEGFA